MATAREQAREATEILQISGDPDPRFGPTPVDYADVVSDVWEPIILDIIDAWDEAQDHVSIDAYAIMNAAIVRAKEALEND